MNYQIEEIEGIGPVFGEKLREAGIVSTKDLLARCGSKPGRVECATATSIPEAKLLDWANMADMMRVSGIGKQFAEMLEAAGVDTVKELRTRNVTNLAAALKEVNDAKRLAKSVPSEDAINEWIEQAKTMEPAISH